MSKTSWFSLVNNFFNDFKVEKNIFYNCAQERVAQKNFLNRKFWKMIWVKSVFKWIPTYLLLVVGLKIQNCGLPNQSSDANFELTEQRGSWALLKVGNFRAVRVISRFDLCNYHSWTTFSHFSTSWKGHVSNLALSRTSP